MLFTRIGHFLVKLHSPWWITTSLCFPSSDSPWRTKARLIEFGLLTAAFEDWSREAKAVNTSECWHNTQDDDQRSNDMAVQFWGSERTIVTLSSNRSCKNPLVKHLQSQNVVYHTRFAGLPLKHSFATPRWLVAESRCHLYPCRTMPLIVTSLLAFDYHKDAPSWR